MPPVNCPDHYEMSFVVKFNPMEEKPDKIIIAELNSTRIHNKSL